MGCLHYAAEADDDDLLFPLLMQSMAGSGHAKIDPMLLMMLNGQHNAKKMLPFLMMSNGATTMDPAMMMMFMEETACEMKFHIPTKYFVRNDVDNQMEVVEDKDQVKTFFKDLYADYAKCVDSASSEDSDDNMLFWLMMMGMPITA